MRFQLAKVRLTIFLASAINNLGLAARATSDRNRPVDSAEDSPRFDEPLR